MNNVKYKDREEPISTLQLALSSVGFNITYQNAELVYLVIHALKPEGDRVELSTLVRIKKEWGEYWEEYQKTELDED